MTKVGMRPAAQEDEQLLYSVYCVNMRDVVEQTRGWDEAWQLAEVESRAVGGRRFL